PAEHNRDDVQLQFAKRTDTQPLPYRPAPMQTHAPSGSCCTLRAFKGGLDSAGDELERRALTHVIGTRAVSEHEDRNLEWRMRTPRRLSVLVTVAAHDHRSELAHLFPDDLLHAELSSVGDVVGEPAVKDLPACSEHFLWTRIATRVVAVDRNTQAGVDGHTAPSDSLSRRLTSGSLVLVTTGGIDSPLARLTIVERYLERFGKRAKVRLRPGRIFDFDDTRSQRFLGRDFAGEHQPKFRACPKHQIGLGGGRACSHLDPVCAEIGPRARGTDVDLKPRGSLDG